MPDLADTDPDLVGKLRKAGDRWGRLGVALAAAQLSDPLIVAEHLRAMLPQRNDVHTACRAIQAGEREQHAAEVERLRSAIRAADAHALDLGAAAEVQADALRAEVARLTGLLDERVPTADLARLTRERDEARAEVLRLGEQFYRADSDGYLGDAETYEPDPALGASPEVVALMRLDRILGNERALSEKGTGRVRGVVLDALRAWHTRHTAGVSRVEGDLLVIPETFLPTPEHPAALRVSGPGLVEYDGHELRITYDTEEQARPGLAPDPTIDEIDGTVDGDPRRPHPDSWPDDAVLLRYRELRDLVALHLDRYGDTRSARAMRDGDVPLRLAEVLRP